MSERERVRWREHLRLYWFIAIFVELGLRGVNHLEIRRLNKAGGKIEVKDKCYWCETVYFIVHTVRQWLPGKKTTISFFSDVKCDFVFTYIRFYSEDSTILIHVLHDILLPCFFPSQNTDL